MFVLPLVTYLHTGQQLDDNVWPALPIPRHSPFPPLSTVDCGGGDRRNCLRLKNKWKIKEKNI